MNHFFESIINLFFPPKCPFCGKVLDAVGVCSKCEKDLPWLPEEEVAFTEKDLTCAAPLWYEGAVREALLRLRFRGGSALAEPVGELLARCAAERFGGEFDTVTWVPVSQKRLETRGYDQSRLLAEQLAKELGLPLREGVLARDGRATAHAAEGRAARIALAQESYRAGSDLRRDQTGALPDILLDALGADPYGLLWRGVE